MRDGSTNSDPCPSTLAAAMRYFTDLGFDTIPLLPQSKRAWMSGWQLRSPQDLWDGAAPNSNVGIRGGGAAHVVVFDFDDKKRPGTSQRGLQWLGGLGLGPSDYPLVRTASGVGRHVYARLDGALPGQSTGFHTGLGSGEVRHGSGAYVVAPPSTVGGNRYDLLSGSFRRLPTLAVHDVLTLLGIPPIARELVTPPANNILAGIPPRTWQLLNGIGLRRYPSRSEAEQAIVMSLIVAGFGLDAVIATFDMYPCAGRFREESAKSRVQAIAWLARGYDKAVLLMKNSEGAARHRARQAEEWAQSRRWAGRTGQQDKLVFVAHTRLAGRSRRLTYAASVRDLASVTALSPKTCARATKRLERMGLLELVSAGVSEWASTYRLVSQSATLPHSGGGGGVSQFETGGAAYT